MKSFKQLALGAFLILSVFVAAFYGSCTKSACAGVACLNKGTCSGGTCMCDSGTGGNNCQTIYRELYGNTYSGASMTSYSKADTAHPTHTDANNTLVFSYGNDSMYNNMQVIWNDSGNAAVTMAITLSNNTPTGSDFIVQPVSINGLNYSGTGSISATTASISLSAALPDSSLVVITMNNFTKQ